MNFKARTLKINSFILGFGRGAQVGKASFLEVNLRRKRRRWAYHFYLVRFRPWDPTNPRFWKKTEAFFSQSDRVIPNQSYIGGVDPPPQGGGSPFFENILINTSDPNIFVIIRKRKYERMF